MNNSIINSRNVLLFTFLLVTTIFGGFLFFETAQAQYGSACSEYGPMAYESGGYCTCMAGYVMGERMFGDSYCISEDQSCKDTYGYNARASFTGGCECQSGYVFDTNTFGDKECVSANSICHDEYGIMSRYDSLSNSCECSYGYVLGEDSIGRTQCISENQACQNQLGIHSSASYGGQCECDYGYVIDTTILGDKQCTDGDQVCRNDHGYNSSYDNLSNKCECDDGYTFDDDNQCVEKHNSAYFTLLDISADGDKLLLQSQYDYQNYIIEYGLGCWDYAIEAYENVNLVINMGTDFSVDMFDTLVLPNHDQNCSIMSVDWTSDDSFPEPKEEGDSFYYVPPESTSPTNVNAELSTVSTTPEPVNFEPTPSVEQENDIVAEDDIETETEVNVMTATSSGDQEDMSSTQFIETEQEDVKFGFFVKIINFFKGLF